jgi:hypothetical protein
MRADSVVGKCRPDSGTVVAAVVARGWRPRIQITSASAITLPPRATPHDSPASTFRRVLPQFDAKEPDQFQTRRVWL